MSIYITAFRTILKDDNTGKDAVIQGLNDDPDVTKRCVFYSPSEAAKINQADIIHSKPEADFCTEDLTGVERGRKITINAVAYYVKDLFPDETGLTRVVFSTEQL